MFYTKLDNRDYFDLVVTKDCRDFYRDYNECNLINVNLTEDLCSIPGAVQTENVELKNITRCSFRNLALLIQRCLYLIPLFVFVYVNRVDGC